MSSVSLLLASSSGCPQHGRPGPEPAARPPTRQPRRARCTDKNVLYASGVGYFQARWHIDGHGQVASVLRWTTIMTCSRAMIAQDFVGGK